jgi:hypothetical protein
MKRVQRAKCRDLFRVFSVFRGQTDCIPASRALRVSTPIFSLLRFHFFPRMTRINADSNRQSLVESIKPDRGDKER